MNREFTAVENEDCMEYSGVSCNWWRSGSHSPFCWIWTRCTWKRTFLLHGKWMRKFWDPGNRVKRRISDRSGDSTRYWRFHPIPRSPSERWKLYSHFDHGKVCRVPRFITKSTLSNIPDYFCCDGSLPWFHQLRPSGLLFSFSTTGIWTHAA